MRIRRLASPVVAMLGLGFLAWAIAGPPSDLEEPAAWCRAHARAGDVVLAAGCRSTADEDLFGEVSAICAESPPLDRLARFRRVLAVRPTPATATLLDARFGAPVQKARGVRVHRVAPVRFDLAKALSAATVSRGGAACPRRGNRHTCSGASWRTVEPRDVTIGGASIPCVFAHPSEDGLAIEVPLPAGVTKLSGAAGLSDKAAARPGGPPVSLRASIDDRQVASRQVPNRRGLVPIAFAAPRTGRLRLDLRTTSQGARSFCLVLWGSR